MASVSTTTSHTTPSKFGSRSLVKRWLDGDAIAHLITLVFAASILLITALLVMNLWQGSADARHKFGWHFFFTSTWDPVAGDFGALPFIYGTLVTSALALIIAVPLGLGAAIFLAELAPRRISDALAFLIDLLAAVPSVIYGLLGIFIVVPAMRLYIAPFLKSTLGFLPLFQGPSYGVGMLTAGIVLAVWWCLSLFLYRVKSCSLCRLTSEKPHWDWVQRDGRQPGRWSCPMPEPAYSDRFSWPWPAH